MKEKKYTWFRSDLFILACVIVFVLLCFILRPLSYVNAALNLFFFEYVDMDQVESVSGPGGKLDADQTKGFIWLVNSAVYRGSDIGYGTTPEYGVRVHLRDGSELSIQEYGDYNFIVSHRINGHREKYYFITSEKLDIYMAEWMDRGHP